MAMKQNVYFARKALIQEQQIEAMREVIDHLLQLVPSPTHSDTELWDFRMAMDSLKAQNDFLEKQAADSDNYG